MAVPLSSSRTAEALGALRREWKEPPGRAIRIRRVSAAKAEESEASEEEHRAHCEKKERGDERRGGGRDFDK